MIKKDKSSKDFKKIILFFSGTIVILAVVLESYLLAAVSVLTAMAFVILINSRRKIRIDEREKIICEKAAQLTYSIFAPTIGIGAFFLLLPYQKISPVFAKGEFVYLESLGMILAYQALFLIVLYAISYYFLNRKYSGGQDKEDER
ncbi:MAG: hypothetical protein BWY24_00339 [Microgenomates group bacterium ADurb.Bin219]|nr:MAG: hypothetical protein BWY24_00339 [Microgenomates group bacterium ADurb.Bin219]